jgi:hypothetical protein
MVGKYEVGYGKAPISSRFQPGRTGNPAGRPKEYRPPFDPGIILQSIESEQITVTANGKRKRMSKAEIQMRQSFTQAVNGDMGAAKAVLGMAKRYFAPEVQSESERGPLFMTEAQAARWERERKSKRSAQPVSRSQLFRKISRERVVIEILGRKTKRTLFEALLRQISAKALARDELASNLLELARKQFPGARNLAAQQIFILTEVDMRL